MSCRKCKETISDKLIYCNLCTQKLYWYNMEKFNRSGKCNNYPTCRSRPTDWYSDNEKWLGAGMAGFTIRSDGMMKIHGYCKNCAKDYFDDKSVELSAMKKLNADLLNRLSEANSELIDIKSKYLRMQLQLRQFKRGDISIDSVDPNPKIPQAVVKSHHKPQAIVKPQRVSKSVAAESFIIDKKPRKNFRYFQSTNSNGY